MSSEAVPIRRAAVGWHAVGIVLRTMLTGAIVGALSGFVTGTMLVPVVGTIVGMIVGTTVGSAGGLLVGLVFGGVRSAVDWSEEAVRNAGFLFGVAVVLAGFIAYDRTQIDLPSALFVADLAVPTGCGAAVTALRSWSLARGDASAWSPWRSEVIAKLVVASIVSGAVFWLVTLVEYFA